MPGQPTKQPVLLNTSEDIQEAPRPQPIMPVPVFNNGNPIGPVLQPPLLVRRIHRDRAQRVAERGVEREGHPGVVRRLVFEL